MIARFMAWLRGRQKPTSVAFYRPPRPPVYRPCRGIKGKPDLVRVSTGCPAVLIVGDPMPLREQAERDLLVAKRRYGFPSDAGGDD